MRYGGVIYCYYREARGAAARALRAAKVKAEYLSAAALRVPRDPTPTPRYIFHDITEAQLKKLTDALAADGDGTELYTEIERG